MGILEDTIFSIYKKALAEGDFDQAKKAVELATTLKTKTEVEGFIDPVGNKADVKPLDGDFFEPLPYRYYKDEGVVVIDNTAISLTEAENKLFSLFSSLETFGSEINLVTPSQISAHMWPNIKVTNNAVRTAVLRLRDKIDQGGEKSKKRILNLYNKGYIFVGRVVKNPE